MPVGGGFTSVVLGRGVWVGTDAGDGASGLQSRTPYWLVKQRELALEKARQKYQYAARPGLPAGLKCMRCVPRRKGGVGGGPAWLWLYGVSRVGSETALRKKGVWTVV